VKGKEYEHEREVRVVTCCDGNEKGVIIRKIAAERLVREIVLSPVWPHQEGKAVEEFLRRHEWGHQPPVIRTSTLLGPIPEEEETRDRIAEYFDTAGRGEAGLPRIMTEL